jgi:hypothetical protein
LHAALRNGSTFVSDENEQAEIQARLATLLPFVFEAQLFQALTDVLAGVPFDVLALTQLIDDIRRITQSSKPYATLADTVLMAATVGPPHQDPSPSICFPTYLPVEHTVTLLGSIVSAMRAQDDSYDTTKAARWIRCVVQLVVDAREAGHSRDSRDDKLQLITAIITEATQLAASSVHAYEAYRHDHMQIEGSAEKDDGREPQLYPEDELQWLSTVLFNLAVDLYVAEKPDEGQVWARRAVEIAEALALVEGVQAEESGEDGTVGRREEGNSLVKLLKAKGKQVGWEL